MDNNIITYKIKYNCLDNEKNIILSYMQNYNKCLKFIYNRMVKSNKTTSKEILSLLKNTNNIKLPSGFIDSAIYNSRAIIKRFKNNHICFGGKKLYNDYNKGLITKEDLKIKRLVPLYAIGKSNRKGNSYFQIISDNKILFKPTKKIHINLDIRCGKNRKQDLIKLIKLQEQKAIPITYKLDLDYIYISFDLNKIREIKPYNPKMNRVFAIDLNPNYIGYSITDWKSENKYKIINTGIISFKKLNDKDFALNGNGFDSKSSKRKYLINKRKYEVEQVGIQLVKIAKQNHCEIFSMEDLTIKNSNKEKGKKFNKLCNNLWNRRKLINIIQKYCKLNNIKILKVIANYSSFIGNLVYRSEKLPDMILSSIEIGRRAYEFNLQYINKTKDIKKNIIFPDLELVKDRINQTLEVLGYSESCESLFKLYYSLKNSKLKYRVSLDSIKFKVFSFKNKSSFINKYCFYN